jgi:hypothetical protein
LKINSCFVFGWMLIVEWFLMNVEVVFIFKGFLGDCLAEDFFFG